MPAATIFQLNIGLKVDHTGFVFPADVALSILASHGIFQAKHVADAGYPAPRVEQSDSEPTLVGWFITGQDNPRSAIWRSAQAMQQKAIAAVLPGDIGELIGPNAEAWNGGVFDPTHFIAA